MWGETMYWGGMGFVMLIWLGLVLWGIVFTFLVLNKLDMIIHLLEKK